MKRLVVRKHGVNVSAEITTANGRANPWGWSTADLVHTERIGMIEVERTIGYLYCGVPQITDADYEAEIVEVVRGDA